MAVNWGIYFAAIFMDRIVECSLGYYINPLISIIFGCIFLGESLTKIKLSSIILATIGVLYLTIAYGKFPFIALGVAVTFGAYGILKKKMKVETIDGMFMEMLFLFPIALAIQYVLINNGTSAYITGAVNVGTIIMFALCGMFTVLPLVMYNKGVKLITLGNVGFLQFITPTMMFVIGVFINGEVFTRAHTISFMFIWGAVILYCVGLIVSRKKVLA